MMLTADYVRLMARYNAWQNAQITRVLDGVSLKLLTEDHGAFFGSILGTLNHILWADRMWLHRFGVEENRPEGGIKESPTLTPPPPPLGPNPFSAASITSGSTPAPVSSTSTST